MIKTCNYKCYGCNLIFSDDINVPEDGRNVIVDCPSCETSKNVWIQFSETASLALSTSRDKGNKKMNEWVDKQRNFKKEHNL